MAREITSLYLYNTGDRPDGFAFCLSAVYADGPTADLALVKSVIFAHLFARTLGEELGVPVNILPSAEIPGPVEAPSVPVVTVEDIKPLLTGDPWRSDNN